MYPVSTFSSHHAYVQQLNSTSVNGFVKIKLRRTQDGSRKTSSPAANILVSPGDSRRKRFCGTALLAPTGMTRTMGLRCGTNLHHQLDEAWLFLLVRLLCIGLGSDYRRRWCSGNIGVIHGRDLSSDKRKRATASDTVSAAPRCPVELVTAYDRRQNLRTKCFLIIQEACLKGILHSFSFEINIRPN